MNLGPGPSLPDGGPVGPDSLGGQHHHLLYTFAFRIECFYNFVFVSQFKDTKRSSKLF